MESDALEAGGRERLGHQDGGGAQAAADVEHAGPGGQPGGDAVEGGQPVVDQAEAVERAEEAGHSAEQAVVVAVPGEALAGAERLGQVVGGLPGGGLDLRLRGAGRDGGVVGQHEGVLVGQFERRRGGVVG